MPSMSPSETPDWSILLLKPDWSTVVLDDDVTTGNESLKSVIIESDLRRTENLSGRASILAEVSDNDFSID